ncbi:hypothetical protein KI387_035250, partial [Taxus chinensis]
ISSIAFSESRKTRTEERGPFLARVRRVEVIYVLHKTRRRTEILHQTTWIQKLGLHRLLDDKMRTAMMHS